MVSEDPLAAPGSDGRTCVRKAVRVAAALRRRRLPAVLAPSACADFARQVTAAKLASAKVTRGRATGVLLTREGALPGAANWTHEHADAANTRVSQDQLVKAPLGVLWFGGPSHTKASCRATATARSRRSSTAGCIIEGVDMLRAVDIYTGRLLWETTLPGVGKRLRQHRPPARRQRQRQQLRLDARRHLRRLRQVLPAPRPGHRQAARPSSAAAAVAERRRPAAGATSTSSATT